MSLSLGNVGLILADGDSDVNGDLPISPDTQEAVVSTLSIASSALLFVIVAGAGECDYGLFLSYFCLRFVGMFCCAVTGRSGDFFCLSDIAFALLMYVSSTCCLSLAPLLFSASR